MKVNFSSKKRKQYTAKNLLTLDGLKSNCPYVLARQLIVSQAAQVYDPLGLVIPSILLAKVLIRKLYMKDEYGSYKSVDWDKIMPEKMKQEWLSFSLELYYV